MASDDIIISVFTCTFNRLDTLRRTFESLKAQSFKNFEWILVDNGSTDETSKVVPSWIPEADFPIILQRRETNTGFQSVYNEGVRLARGGFFLSLDSDDMCVPEALECLMERWNSIPREQQSKFVGVTVCCNDQHGNLVGDEFPVSPLDSNILEIEMHHKVKGEKWGLLRVDVLKDFPFPDTEHHIHLGHIWRAIARTYLTRYTNDKLRIYYIEEDSREDQLSYHLSPYKSAYGKRLNSHDYLNYDISWFSSAPLIFIKNALNYSRNSYLLGDSAAQQLKNVKPLLAKILVAISLPYGFWWASNAARKHTT